MRSSTKTWTGLGLSAALFLTGCGNDDETSVNNDAADRPQTASVSGSGELGLGEGGEAGEGSGGEGGEGGVDVAAALKDPIIYRAALGITEAHVLAARDAYLVGETEAAAEMFAHPVSEVLADMEPVFNELGVAVFYDEMIGASTAALGGAAEAEIEEYADKIVQILRDAAGKAPSSDVSSGAIAAGVVADQIERATAQYARAQEIEDFEPYLDGYGYAATAAALYDSEKDVIASDAPGAVSDIEAALGLLSEAYPSVTRPEVLDLNAGALSGASARVMFSLQ